MFIIKQNPIQFDNIRLRLLLLTLLYLISNYINNEVLGIML